MTISTVHVTETRATVLATVMWRMADGAARAVTAPLTWLANGSANARYFLTPLVGAFVRALEEHPRE
jgi:hypothetical protein